MLISVRADVGGGPEHIHTLLRHFPMNILPVVACPQEKPYWDRYAKLLGEEKLISIPHRSFSFKTFIELKRQIIKRQVNLIHAHGKGAGLYGRLLAMFTRIPCLYTFHGLHVGDYGRLSRWTYLNVERQLGRWTSKMIAVSASEAEEIRQMGLARYSQLQIIPNGVEVPELSPPGCYASNPLRMIHITRYNQQKNPKLLLSIIRELSRRPEAIHFRLEILGDGPQREWFLQQLETEGLSQMVQIYGNVDDPARILPGAFCCLNTSLWEGMPLSLLEAMAHGIPVVASRITGNTDIVQEGINGFLYNVSNPAEAADHIVKLANEPRWPVYSHNAWQWVRERHSAQTMSQSTALLYINVISNTN